MAIEAFSSDLEERNRALLILATGLGKTVVGGEVIRAHLDKNKADDILIVAANERIRSVQPIQFLFQPYWQDQEHAGIYRPLTIFSFSVEYSIWKAWAPGFRLTNLFLHALNGWLVFLIVQSLIGSPVAAWASAAVYIVHPVQTEAVVSIVGRSELLAVANDSH